MQKSVLSILVAIALITPSALSAQGARTFDGWELTQTAEKCEATFKDDGGGISGYVVIDSVPPSDIFRFGVSIEKIPSLPSLGESRPDLQVRAILDSGEVLELPTLTGSGFGESSILLLAPSVYDPRYLSKVTGQPVSIAMRVDQRNVSNPDPNKPYQKVFSITPKFSELVAELSACKARTRSNSAPVLLKDIAEKASLCPVYPASAPASGRVRFDVPSGTYRLLVDKSGRVTEVQPPPTHQIPDKPRSAKTNLELALHTTLKDISITLARRLRFKPGFDSDYEPKTAWVEYSWPVVTCS